MSDQSSTKDRQLCHRLTVTHCVQGISSLLVPLALGIFTVVITLYQQNVINQQRLEDRHLAKEQREQDMNESRQQRLEDRLIAHEQRDLDLNISRLQREQDLKIANDKRFNDDFLAEQQRNMSREQRAHELDIEQERHRDELLMTFINEIGDLLADSNWAFTGDQKTSMLVRAKTLIIVRQLDSVRNSHLIRFLIEAGQLTDGGIYPPLDLSTAQLDGIDLSGSLNMHGLFLPGTYLRNASFVGCDLSNANFSGAHLDGTFFSQSILTSADFSRAKVNDADFGEISANQVIFTRSEGQHVNFTGSKLNRSFFNRTNMPESTFVDVEATEAIFDYSSLHFAVFTRCNCSKIRFENSHLVQSDFTNANLSKATFRFTYLDKVNFHYARAHYARFYMIPSALQASFTNSDLANADFASSNFDSSTFQDANMKKVSFTKTSLTNANFLDANLYKADLSDTKLTLTQLESALTFLYAELFNSSKVRDRNLVRNGHAECGKSIDDDWIVQKKGNIVVVKLNNSTNNCKFTLSNAAKSTGASMSQRINSPHIGNKTSSWKHTRFILKTTCANSKTKTSLTCVNSTGYILSKFEVGKSHFVFPAVDLC